MPAPFLFVSHRVTAPGEYTSQIEVRPSTGPAISTSSISIPLAPSARLRPAPRIRHCSQRFGTDEGGCSSASACAEKAREFIRLCNERNYQGYSFWHWGGAPLALWQVLNTVAA